MATRLAMPSKLQPRGIVSGTAVLGVRSVAMSHLKELKLSAEARVIDVSLALPLTPISLNIYVLPPSRSCLTTSMYHLHAAHTTNGQKKVMFTYKLSRCHITSSKRWRDKNNVSIFDYVAIFPPIFYVIQIHMIKTIC